MTEHIEKKPYAFPSPGSLASVVSTRADWVKCSKLIKDGLPASFFNDLSTLIGLAPSDLARLIGVKESARRRWVRTGTLNMRESDYLFQTAAVLYSALGLFEGDQLATQEWLNRPALALGQKTPAELLSTFVGMNLVEALIWKIENGVVV
ncbi:antitoxin Xre/MbcA/ParS toxin-binding domain-containing protein [Pseudomonas izuensis]|uniref:antitoxin Xre/MbcA/ParS toxin-binding domain-containing protein n=1 Tax=Pseudomonas izuensis TaxID=2684212 RepID=UPI001359E9A6|nr:antitoxin Xre/MbcA/ParS toxin-binding domain-containing protein [Pseudomonas izuensis]